MVSKSAVIDAYLFERYVLDVAITTLRDGVSASKINSHRFLQPVDAWGFPKYPGKTAILPPGTDLVAALKLFIATNAALLAEEDAWLGTWINPHTQHYYLDITTSRADLEEARRVALACGARDGRRIVALYNSLRQETVYL